MFFGGIGGEEKAGFEPEVREEKIGIVVERIYQEGGIDG